MIRETQAVQQSEEFNQKKDRIGIVEKRISELEKLILRIYEDNILGRLSDDRYTLLDQQYAKEQQALRVELAELSSTPTAIRCPDKIFSPVFSITTVYINGKLPCIPTWAVVSPQLDSGK